MADRSRTIVLGTLAILGIALLIAGWYKYFAG